MKKMNNTTTNTNAAHCGMNPCGAQMVTAGCCIGL